VKAIKPGATTKDLAEKWPDETKIWGLESADEGTANNWGHGLGLSNYESPMISRIWSLDFPYPIKPGMVT
jgi:Xaa-Pro aminopeptidase